MSGKRYPEEFKIEAVKQVVDRGYSVSSVATRLDITTHSLYAWIKKYGPDSSIVQK
ncbi:transposase, partial [Escherichia coli]|uniref:transposase n=1 Tax=Escherichia coli TaxID=562 RepID=UPI0021E7D39C